MIKAARRGHKAPSASAERCACRKRVEAGVSADEPGRDGIEPPHALAVGFMRKFEGTHFGHDLGDKLGAVAELVVVAEMQREVGKLGPTLAIKEIGPRGVKRLVEFHRTPTRRAAPRTRCADEAGRDWVDQRVREFVDDIFAVDELDLAQRAGREHVFAALPIHIVAARQMRVEMMREVRDAPVRVVHDDVVVIRHQCAADKQTRR